MEVRVDSKGRICLPSEFREELGEVFAIKKIQSGLLLIPGKPKDFLEEFRKIVTTEPTRTGKPENWSPSRMKGIWRKG